MLELVLNTARTVPVYLMNTTHVPVTGIAFGGATCKISKNGAALAAVTLTALNWTELGQGLYTIDLTDAETDTAGWFTYLVTGTGAVQYRGEAIVVLKGQCHFATAYNEATTELVIRTWLEIDGRIVVAPTSCSVSVRDDTEAEVFTFTDLAPSADGFFTMKETGPTLSDDHNYSVEVSIVYGGNTYVSGDCLLTVK